MNKIIKRVVVSGAAGQLSYSLLFRIANGDMLGKNQPIILHLLDLPQAKNCVNGVAMELEDCNFPLLQQLIITDDLKVAFKDVDIALLVGAYPRTKGMERKDLLNINAKIFATQGRILNEVASRNVKVLVIGNPANTNTYIAMKNAPDLPRTNFTAMLRLDYNRALHQLSSKSFKPASDIKNLIIWGNHSTTVYPDFRFATVYGHNLSKLINDDVWNRNVFIPNVSNRGTSIIEVRGLSSAASAANAAIEHIHDWLLGSNGKWISMGVPSNGEYNIPENIVYGFPVITKNGNYTIVENLEIDAFSSQKMNISLTELKKEYLDVSNLNL